MTVVAQLHISLSSQNCQVIEFQSGMHNPPRPREKWLPQAAPAPKSFKNALPHPKNAKKGCPVHPWFQWLNNLILLPDRLFQKKIKTWPHTSQAINRYIEPNDRWTVLQFLFGFSFESRQGPSLTHDINKFDNKTMGGVLTFYRDSGRGRGNIFSSE